MGYSLYRLEVIKTRFVNSDPKDLKNLLRFIEEQLKDSEEHSRESMFTVFLDQKIIERVRVDVAEIAPVQLEDILSFTEERIKISRISDKADKITGQLARDDYYFREEKYSKIENYIIKLTLG